MESRDNRSEHSMARKKLVDERVALRTTLEKEISARRRKLEELNKQKRQLPISKDIKDSKKVVGLNLEHLVARERMVEAQIKRSISTGQDKASSKELSVIAAQRRQVKEVRTTISRINPHPPFSTKSILRRF
jgi:bacillopeptidase F (M6 metalloprotease family)